MEDHALTALFYEMFQGLDRCGPGDDRSTERALRLCGDLGSSPLVLDMGCGPGEQSLTLAGALPAAHIAAVDNYPPFLKKVRERAASGGRPSRILPLQGDMAAPPFKDCGFDLIWSEGAVYIMGFDAGLACWKPLLRPGGRLAVSELTWLTDSPPPEAREFWAAGYPAMRTRKANVAAIAAAGYALRGDFVLPAESWFSRYYTPLEQRVRAMRAGLTDPKALAVLDEQLQEIDLYRRHGDAYGYVFYVMQTT